MDLRMPWLSAYCHQKHCIFISSLSAESGGKGIENSKIFNFNRLKIKSTKLPNSHDRLNHRSLLDNLETVTHLTKEPHPKEGAKTFPSWTVSLWLGGGRGREFEGKEFESSISSGPFLGTNTGWAQTSIPFEGIPYHQRPPFPIPRESCCTFPRRAPSRQSNANTALIRGTRPPPNARFESFLNHYLSMTHRSAQFSRVHSPCVFLFFHGTLRRYLRRWMRRYGSGPVSPLRRFQRIDSRWSWEKLGPIIFQFRVCGFRVSFSSRYVRSRISGQFSGLEA